DETAPVLKTFIIGLENLLSLKVKVIRCDNGIEFKNSNLNQFCGLKGIKREFSVPRTPQQDGIAERKNRTLIEAARILLADSLLPIPFWAEAVNTVCYVQNRVLVTKPHNKTPYELLHGRLPGIGFLRPFGYPVTILNTLDPLGKFQGKVDEGFLVGYSVCNKAFRVFNSRTRLVQETLHVNFMENKPNVAGYGPAWLFDIDSLTQTMNYHPVLAENQTNSHVGIQDTEKAGEEGTQTYVLFPVDLNAKFEECTNNRSNGVNAASSSVFAVGHNCINSTNDFSAAGPSNTVASLTAANTSDMPNLEDLTHSNDTDDVAANTSDMPNLEDLTHSNDTDDVGAEADINNLESIILVSPIPTTRIHKDHPTSQIMGDLFSTTQARSMARAVRDQGGISQMFNEDFHTCMFACFLSQEEPKRVHQAL
nr:putative ribonuclease H-like domain-containing protein [Tanacetum cinerariifolium]